LKTARTVTLSKIVNIKKIRPINNMCIK